MDFDNGKVSVAFAVSCVNFEVLFGSNFTLHKEDALKLAQRIFAEYGIEQSRVPEVEENNSAQGTEISVSFPDGTVSIKQNGNVQVLSTEVLECLSKIWGMAL